MSRNYARAIKIIQEERRASIALFQRRLNLGYLRAAEIMTMLEKNGVVEVAHGAKPRQINWDLIE